MKQQLSNKSKIPLIAISISLCLGTIVSFNLLPANILTAQPVKNKRKVPSPPPPPSDRGFPGQRTVSASMSNCDLPIVAIAPKFKSAGEESVWGKTTQERPTFWFSVPATPPSTQLEFSLQNRQGDDIYRAPISTPTQPGVIGVRLSADRPALQIDRDYRWTLKARVPCGSAAPNRVHVDGWVTRVNLPPIASERGDVYKEKGIWYDAVTNFARQKLQNPQDITLQQDWIDLLGALDLAEIAKQPLLK